MANEQQQTQPQVAIPLPKGKKNAVQIGCICMMLSVAMYGLVFATLTSPILESVNAMGYVSLFSIFAGMGVSIMTCMIIRKLIITRFLSFNIVVQYNSDTMDF